MRSLPIKQWRYKAQDALGLSVEHIGPMAQDFWSAFHIGDDSLGISTIDPAGVALAAIQELAKQKDAEIAALRAKTDAEIATLRTRVEALERRLSAMLPKQ